MTEIRGPSDPKNRGIYQEEYKHSVDLFQKALDQYQNSKGPFQKKEFQEVMDQAMTVLNQSAQQLKNGRLQQQNEKIASDYKNFQAHPEDPAWVQKLHQDLDEAKKSV